MTLALSSPAPFGLLEAELFEYHKLASSTNRVGLEPTRVAEKIGVNLDGWQADVLRSPARQIILNCSRQSGKSITAALLATHTTVYQPGSLVLLLSPSLRQSQELFRKCLDVYRVLSEVADAETESKLRLELENGSRLIALPGKESTIRGFSGAALLIADEAARVPDSLYQAIRPMIAVSGGRVLLLSTPCGKRGFFFQEWTEGGDSWERVEVTAHDCPRISAEWLQSEREAIGDYWFDQEYLCQFRDSVDQIFSTEAIMAALDSTVTPLFG